MKYKGKYISLKNKQRTQRGGAIGPFPMIDEIHFWGRQMAEHLLFLYLGLEDLSRNKANIENMDEKNMYMDTGKLAKDMNEMAKSTKTMQSNTMQTNAMKSNEMKSSAMQANAMKSNEMQANAMKSNEMQANAMKSNEMKSNEMQANAMKSNEMKSNEMKSNEMKSNAMQPTAMKSNEIDKQAPIMQTNALNQQLKIADAANDLLQKIGTGWNTLTTNFGDIFKSQKGGDNFELKEEAFVLLTKWKMFMNEFFYDNGIVVDIDQDMLRPEQIDVLMKKNIETDAKNKVHNLIDKTIMFKEKLIGELNKPGVWIGWNYLSMIDHMLEEAKYFKGKVDGNLMEREEEIKYIIKHHGTEMAATAQLIDPMDKQQPDIDVVRAYATRTMSILLKKGSYLREGTELPGNHPDKSWLDGKDEMLRNLDASDMAAMLPIAIKYSTELEAFAKETKQRIEFGTLKSVIHPVLAHHILRELMRFTKTLKYLEGNTQTMTNVNQTMTTQSTMANQMSMPSKMSMVNQMSMPSKTSMANQTNMNRLY